MAPGRIPNSNAQQGKAVRPRPSAGKKTVFTKRLRVSRYGQRSSSRSIIDAWQRLSATMDPHQPLFVLNTRKWMPKQEWLLRSQNDLLLQLHNDRSMPRWKKQRAIKNVARILISAALTGKPIHMPAWTEWSGLSVRKKIEHKSRTIRLRKIALKHARLFRPFMVSCLTRVATSTRYTTKLRARALRMLYKEKGIKETYKLKAMLATLLDIKPGSASFNRDIAGTALRVFGTDLAIEIIVDEAASWRPGEKKLHRILGKIASKSDKYLLKIINCFLRCDKEGGRLFGLNFLVKFHSDPHNGSRLTRKIARIYFHHALANAKPPTFEWNGATLTRQYDHEGLATRLLAGKGLAQMVDEKGKRALETVFFYLKKEITNRYASGYQFDYYDQAKNALREFRQRLSKWH